MTMTVQEAAEAFARREAAALAAYQAEIKAARQELCARLGSLGLAGDDAAPASAPPAGPRAARRRAERERRRKADPAQTQR